MEAADSKNRPSIGPLSAHRESQFSTAAAVDVFGRGYTSAPPNMATTAVMNPTSIFQSHPPSHPPPPYSHHNLTPSLAHPLSALISPSLHSADSRRSLGEDPKGPASQRQSLPSIHEALADAPATYSPYTTSASQYTPAYAPAATTPTRRSFPSDSSQYPPQSNSANPPHRNSPPQPVQPSPSSFPRNEPASRIYPDPLRQPATLRAALPPQTRSNSLSRTPVPRPGSEPHYYDPTGSSNGYGPPPAADQYRAYPPAAPPASNIYTAHSSHDVPYQQRYPSGPENAEELGAKKGESGHMRQGFASVLKRNLDYWDEERSMRELNNSAQRLAQISSDYLAVAQRWGNTPHRGNAALVDLENLRAEHMKIGHCIEQVQTSIEEQEAFVADQQSREQMGKSAMNYDRDDFDAWSGDSKDQGLGGPGPNKRRGRAAPPGRCHSCNRAETPEWRRGPDGARTLCNACGLHYAKLTRKSGAKQGQTPGSSLRPKSMDES